MSEKRLKIGFFIDTYFPMVDGVVMVVDNYVRRLSKIADVTVFTISPRDKKYREDLPYKVIRCKRASLKWIGLDYDLPLPSLDKKFKKAVNEGEFDLIHIHSPFGIGSQGLKYGLKNNVPVVATMHSQFKKDFLKETKSKLLANLMTKKIIKVFNKCTECWAVNGDVAKIFYEEYGAKTLPLTKNNGTDMKLIEDDSTLTDIMQEYNIKKEDNVLLFVGRLTVLKNIMFIADSIKLLKDKGMSFKMLFVGNGPDEERLKERLAKDNVLDNCVFTGRITDREKLAKIYKISDLFLFPSLYDCSSLVQIEASSQKTPSLFLRGSTTSATVTEDVNGYLAENDTQLFANKIIDIFADKELYNTVSENAYKDLYLSWDKAVDTAYNDYLQIITKQKEKNEIC